MRKLTLAASAAALLAITPVFAQAPGAPTPAPGFGIQGGPAPASEAVADVDVETVVAALGNTGAEIDKLATLPDGATVRVVDLDDYVDGNGASTIASALEAAEGQLEDLHNALQGNVGLMNQLASANVQINDVYGIGIEGSDILVFVRQSTANADDNPANIPGGQILEGPAPAAPAQ